MSVHKNVAISLFQAYLARTLRKARRVMLDTMARSQDPETRSGEERCPEYEH